MRRRERGANTALEVLARNTSTCSALPHTSGTHVRRVKAFTVHCGTSRRPEVQSCGAGAQVEVLSVTRCKTQQTEPGLEPGSAAATRLLRSLPTPTPTATPRRARPPPPGAASRATGRPWPSSRAQVPTRPTQTVEIPSGGGGAESSTRYRVCCLHERNIKVESTGYTCV